MALYATLEDAKRELEATQPTSATLTVKDQQMLGKLRAVTQRVNNVFAQRPRWPYFEPTIGTRLLPVNSYNTNTAENTLAFNLFLLELTGTVSVNGTDFADVVTYPDPNLPPFTRLRKTDCCLSWYSLCQQLCVYPAPLLASVPGIWGFNSNYSEAFSQIDTLAVAINDSTSSQITFTVTNVDGPDQYSITPRISIGNLLRIDSTYYEVVLTDPATNIVTALAGVNGSAKATHVIDSLVYRWEVEPAVRNAVARQAAMQYSRIGAFTTSEVQGMAEIRYPQDWLSEIYATLEGYSYS